MRVDKWLWAARFFKTRSLASKACELGRVAIDGQQVKASRELRVGDRLQFRNEAAEFEIDVLALSEMRGPAAVAQTLYLETDASKEKRARVAEERRAMHAAEGVPQGKPSKRDRRRLQKFRGF